MCEPPLLVAGANGLIGRHLAKTSAGPRLGGRLRKAAGRFPARARVPSPLTLRTPRDTRTLVLPRLREITHVFYCARADHPEGGARIWGHLECRDAAQSGGTRWSPCSNGSRAHQPGARHQVLRPSPRSMRHTSRGRGAARPRRVLSTSRSRTLIGGARSCGARWRWSIARPHAYCFEESDNPRSLVLVIAVLAAVQRELGQPLFFPGQCEELRGGGRSSPKSRSSRARSSGWRPPRSARTRRSIS